MRAIRVVGSGIVLRALTAGFEPETDVAELQGDRRGMQRNGLIHRQTHQLSAISHDERSVGGMQVAYRAVSLFVDREDGMPFRHGFVWILDVKSGESILRQWA